MQAIQVQHLSFKYPKRPPIMSNLNLTFKPGTASLITGKSGSGKSTFLKFMAGLYPCFSTIGYKGTIKYGTHKLSQIPASRMSSVVSMLFQNPNYQFTMDRVNEEMQFVLENRQIDPDKFNGIIGRMLNRVGISSLRNRKINTLSGGEKQKVALAIILMLNSQVILLDEPFANVDRKSRQALIQLLIKIKASGKTLIIVDHDVQGYAHLIDKVYRVKNRKLQPTTLKALSKPSVPLKCSIPSKSAQATFGFHNLTIRVQNKTLLNFVNFHFYQDKITLLTGENGVGKSTLFKAMSKLIPYQGQINLYQQEIHSIDRAKYFQRVALIFQDAEDQFINLTVSKELQLSIKNAVNSFYSKDTIQKWLKATGLWHHRKQVVYTLSGGQQKALQLLEMIIMGIPIMLLDEPFQSFDDSLITFFTRLLRKITVQHHVTILIISHQLKGLAPLIDYHVQLKDLTLNYKEH